MYLIFGIILGWGNMDEDIERIYSINILQDVSYLLSEIRELMHILKTCSIMALILELGEEGILTEIKSAVKKTVDRKKVKQLLEVAQNSIGADYGESSAVFRIRQYMIELEMIENQLVKVGEQMKEALEKTGLSEYLLSIQGIGVVSMASVFGEMGDPLRLENPRQMSRMARYNLVEDSSGKNKSGTCISKREHKNL